MAALTRLPKLRTDLVVVEQIQRGETVHVYKVPDPRNYYNLDPLQHAIVQMLDGQRTPEQLISEFNARNLGMDIDLEYLAEYLEGLKDTGLLERSRQEKQVALLEKLRDKRRRRASRLGRYGNLFDLVFPAWNPDRFFHLALPYIRFFWTPGFVMLSATCILVMLGIWVVNWSRTWEGTISMYSFAGKTGGDLVQFFIVVLVSGFFHESAHGLTCRYFGGRVSQMGFGLMFFTPCFYVDVSDITLLDRHYKRQWVIHAGGYFELFICALSTYVWVLTSPGTLVSELSYKMMLVTGITSTLFNLNPLLKLDGYYSLVDWLEIPDLWERSTAYTSGLVKRHVFRLPVDLEATTRRVRRIFCIYTSLSLVYKAMLVVFFGIFVLNVYRSLLGGLAPMAFLLTVLFVFRRQLKAAAVFIRFLFLDKREMLMKPRILVGLAAGSACLFGLLALVPLPVTARGEFVLEPGEKVAVRAAREGIVDRVLVREGEAVRPGQAIAVLTDEDLSRRLAGTERRLARLEGTVSWAMGVADSVALALKARERDQLLGELHLARSQVDDLTLRSPLDGVILTARLEDQLGTRLQPGDPFCEISRSGPLIARVPLREEQLDQIEAGQAATLRLVAFPFQTLEGEVLTLAPASTDAPTGGTPSGPGTPRGPSILAEFTHFEAIVEVTGHRLKLKPGMAGTAHIRIDWMTTLARAWRAGTRWLGSTIW